ncbi:MBL fold metallo-hydrolase [Petrimonas sp.]|uniref:MBL fold metallo-hydrolase n=1 Tax=Petrimonas sp. TaxID=2023866 RepID=UPI002FC59AC0|nr:MBL fold metallo-hydrolase [Prolixibacteraceae bacterium]
MNKLLDDILNFTVRSDQLAIWWLGQSGFIFKNPEGKIIVIDAYLSNSAAKNRSELNRLIPIPVHPEELVCDYYICTHSHTDHADPETIKNLKNKESIIFIGPRNVVKLYRQLGIPENNIRLLEAGGKINLGKLSLTATFCIPNSEAVLDSTGIILQYKGIGIYHSGDTGYHPFLNYIGKYCIDMALLCINGKYGNMTYEEAFRLSEAIRPRYALPCHFDMFPINREDPGLFNRLFELKKSETKCIVPQIGKLMQANSIRK